MSEIKKANIFKLGRNMFDLDYKEPELMSLNDAKPNENSKMNSKVETVVLSEVIESMALNSGKIGTNIYYDNKKMFLPQNGLLFDEKNIKYGQFGGNQGSLYENLEEFMRSDMVSRIMTKHLGDNYSVFDKELLFYRMNSVGCGYIAAINIIMEEYLSKHNEIEFYETFGFPPYTLGTDPDTGKLYKDFNYEYLFLDFFLYYGINERNFTTLEEMIGNAEEEREWKKGRARDAALDDAEFDKTGMEGTHVDIVGKLIEKYLEEKGIGLITGKIKAKQGSLIWERIRETLPVDMEITQDLALTSDLLDAEIIQEILNDGNRMNISLSDFSLFYPYDKDGNGILDDVYNSDVGPHAMTVIGTTEDGKIIVSSWGKPYLIDLNIDGIDRYCIYQFEDQPPLPLEEPDFYIDKYKKIEHKRGD